jgi:methylated-DNA-[protein]-cysteine S-methyltransferase
MFYTNFSTSLGDILVTGDENGITSLQLNVGESKSNNKIPEHFVRNDAFFESIKIQILEYLDCKRKSFNIKLNLHGTDFQKKVWNELTKVSYGKTCSYKDIAMLIGNKNANRAVANAIGKNPVALIIPCHRVIGSNGKLTGFAYGLEMKAKLLSLEA